MKLCRAGNNISKGLVKNLGRLVRKPEEALHEKSDGFGRKLWIIVWKLVEAA